MKMKKCLVILFALVLVGFTSCHKTRYCKCTTIIDEEVVELGDGSTNGFFVIEDGRESCAEKAKDIDGWGHVTCTEYSEEEVTGQEHHWWDDIFGNNNNNHNGSGNNGHGPGNP